MKIVRAIWTLSLVLLTSHFQGTESSGLSCYSCKGASTDGECNQHVKKCPSIHQACQTVVSHGKIDKRCMNLVDCWREASYGCVDGKCSYCCDEDECNLELPDGIVTIQREADNPCDPNPCHNGGWCEIRESGETGKSSSKTKSESKTKSSSKSKGHHYKKRVRRNNPVQVDGKSSSKSGTDKSSGKSGSGGSSGEDFDFVCHCPEGYSGPYCEKVPPPSGPCSSNPCHNGGTCHDNSDGSYWCECPQGYSGHRCETAPPPSSPCSSHPCHNGGTCHDTSDGGYWCECPSGYQGDRCETAPPPSSPCSSNPCHNGGTCHDTSDGGYWCECPSGYQGDRCETGDQHPCDAHPCQHGGTCHYDGGDYWCACPPGFEGRHCEIGGGHPCDSHPCQHGGTCHNDGHGFWCVCKPGYAGTLCEIPVNPCNPNPCLHGGTCHNHGGGYYECQCPDGYTGDSCQHAPTEPGTGYDCDDNDPCTQEAIDDGDFYWPHDDPTKFVQCDEWGQCFVMPCPSGLIWDQEIWECVRPGMFDTA